MISIKMIFLISYIPHESISLNLFLLMYADDMVLFSGSIEGLHVLLYELSQYWNLCINVEKNVVFRNKSKIKLTKNDLLQ